MQPLNPDTQTKAAKRVCLFPTQEKIELKKFPSFLKIKNTRHANPDRKMTDLKPLTVKRFRTQTTNRQRLTAPTRKWRCSAS